MRIFGSNLCMSQAGQFIPGGGPLTDVETLTGNTGGAVGPDGSNNINVVGDGTSVTVSGDPGTNTLTVSSLQTQGIVTIDGNSGDITGEVVTIEGALNVSGSTVTFAGNGGHNILTLSLSDGSNTMLGGQSGTGYGYGGENTAVGYYSLGGYGSGGAMTGQYNVSIGYASLGHLKTGARNCVLGYDSGISYTSSESDNILINNNGVLGESHTLRISATGTAAQQVSSAYIGGIDGVALTTANVVTEVSDQLGTAVLTGGTGVTIDASSTPNEIIINSSCVNTIDGDSGSVSGSTISLLANSGSANCGASVSFTAASGTQMDLVVTNSSNNTFIGKSCGSSSITGQNNTAIGHSALTGGFSTTAAYNSCVGSDALYLCTGTYNSAVGFSALESISTGSYNIGVGQSAGSNYTSSESSNILLNSSGVLAESNTLRIGQATGSGNQDLAKAYICGIAGVSVGSVATVVTEASDQLGTAVLTAGTGISITPTANVITIAATGTTNLTYTNVNTSPYTVLSTDEYLSVDCSGGAITLKFPNAATSGRSYVIKDRTGSAATHNITVTTVGGAVNIDGATTLVMNTAYESINIIGNSSSFEVY